MQTFLLLLVFWFGLGGYMLRDSVSVVLSQSLRLAPPVMGSADVHFVMAVAVGMAAVTFFLVASGFLFIWLTREIVQMAQDWAGRLRSRRVVRDS